MARPSRPNCLPVVHYLLKLKAQLTITLGTIKVRVMRTKGLLVLSIDDVYPS